MTKKSLIDYFPADHTPRAPQIEALEHIENCINDNVRFIILECPTGTGKSHIASTLCNYSLDCPDEYAKIVDSNDLFAQDSTAYMNDIGNMNLWGANCLTVTKNLQNQYDSLFPNAATLKGKSNYSCNLDDSFTVDVAPCVNSWKVSQKCIENDVCDFYRATKSAWKNKFAVYNYNKFLTMPKQMRSRQFLICDEASEIEDQLVSFFTTTITYKMLDKYHINYFGEKIHSDNMSHNIKWLKAIGTHLNDQVESLKRSIHSKAYSDSEKRRNGKTLQYCRNLLNSIKLVVTCNTVCKYVCQWDAQQVSFSPLYVDALANVLWGKSEHIVLMSGTIFDHSTFARVLGIKSSDYRFHETATEFNPKESPIFIPAKYAINHKTQNTVLPKVIDQAKEIVEEFKDDNGIIHTHTNKITAEFMNRVKNDNPTRYMFRTGKVTNEHVLLQHALEDDPTVIVSPSMAFGVDLPDDLSRFQIIMKLPYQSLGDKRTKTLFEKDKKWYAMKMFTKLIQMCGRSTRSKDDYSSTYILDLGAVAAIKREWHNLPQEFKDRLE